MGGTALWQAERKRSTTSGGGSRGAGPAPTRAKVVKALESLQSYDLGGITLGYSPTNRIGSRYVEVTVIGSNGRLMK